LTGWLRAVLSPRRWARTAVVVVIEPPFVPPAIWPSTLARQALDGVLDRLDITQLVIDHVSIPRILDSIDIAAVLEGIDLSGIAEQIIEEVDLPGIIRGSTGTLASESVVGVRIQSASADATVDRVVAYLVPGRSRARTANDVG
jgi:hypothetical protein